MRTHSTPPCCSGAVQENTEAYERESRLLRDLRDEAQAQATHCQASLRALQRVSASCCKRTMHSTFHWENVQLLASPNERGT
jgi:hypothetical protein